MTCVYSLGIDWQMNDHIPLHHQVPSMVYNLDCGFEQILATVQLQKRKQLTQEEEGAVLLGSGAHKAGAVFRDGHAQICAPVAAIHAHLPFTSASQPKTPSPPPSHM